MFEIIPGIAVFTADSIIKKHMEESQTIDTSGSSPEVIDKKLFQLRLHHNYGSAGNVGADMPKLVRICSVLLSIFCTVIFVISITFSGSRLMRVGLGLILGGAYSNTYDRLKRGYVVDYIQIKKGPKIIRRLIWNISDYAILLGSLMWLLGDR